MRLTSRIAVVLPQPDGPTSTQISPAGTSKLRSLDRRARPPVVALGDVAELERRRLWVRGRPLVLGGVFGWSPRGAAPVARNRPGSYRSDPRPARRARSACAAPSSASSSGASGSSSPSAVGDQPVGEPRVLGQQRAVEVGADHVVAQDALEAGRARVAVAACSTRPSGCVAGAEVRAPAVVLEAGQHARPRQPGQARPRWRRCRSGAGRPRARCAGRRARRPGSARRRARSGGRAAGSRRTRASTTRPAAAAACRASRLVSTMSWAHSAWSRSWPPPR